MAMHIHIHLTGKTYDQGESYATLFKLREKKYTEIKDLRKEIVDLTSQIESSKGDYRNLFKQREKKYSQIKELNKEIDSLSRKIEALH